VSQNTHRFFGPFCGLAKINGNRLGACKNATHDADLGVDFFEVALVNTNGVGPDESIAVSSSQRVKSVEKSLVDFHSTPINDHRGTLLGTSPHIRERFVRRCIQQRHSDYGCLEGVFQCAAVDLEQANLLASPIQRFVNRTSTSLEVRVITIFRNSLLRNLLRKQEVALPHYPPYTSPQTGKTVSSLAVAERAIDRS
jgi:hypothetical protein